MHSVETVLGIWGFELSQTPTVRHDTVSCAEAAAAATAHTTTGHQGKNRYTYNCSGRTQPSVLHFQYGSQ